MTTIEGADGPPKEKPTTYELRSWTLADVDDIADLEIESWAPWLRKSKKNIATIAERFPTLQLIATTPDNRAVATMTTNRIQWDGDPSHLKTWDTIAGGRLTTWDPLLGASYDGPSNNINSYTDDGNTLCLVSSSVRLDARKTGIAQQLITGAINLANQIGAEHVIGPFRPNGYGELKLAELEADGRISTSFAEYCAQRRPGDGLPVDPWLRTAERMGMQPLAVADESMVVEKPRSTLFFYRKNYNPDTWKQNPEDGSWECGETGTWRVRGDKAIYTEPNLWGKFPLTPPEDVGKLVLPHTRRTRRTIIPLS